MRTIEPALSAALGAPSPVATYLATLAPISRRTMLDSLQRMANLLAPDGYDAWSFPWTDLHYEHLQALRTKLAERYAPATANKHLAAIRGVLREAFRLGQLPPETWERIRLVKSVRGSRPPAGRSLTRGEVGAMFAACDPATARGARDAAALALLYGCGLRRAELQGVLRTDLDAVAGTVLVRGKGNKFRIAPMPAGTLAALLAWTKILGDTDGPLIVATTRGGACLGRSLSERGIAIMLNRLARVARIRPLSPHDLRRSFATQLLDLGVDLAMVKILMGHASIATTTRYDHRDETAARIAAWGLSVPFNEPR